jgi:hypothetical protein
MPRSTKRRSSSVPQTKQSQQPQPQSHPQPMPGSSFGDAVKGGIGMGLGIEAVRGAIGAFSNREPQSQSQPQNQTQYHPCDDLKNLLIKCDDSKNCDVYLKAYQSCMQENKI